MGMFARVSCPARCVACQEMFVDEVQFKFDGPMWGLPKCAWGERISSVSREKGDDWDGLVPDMYEGIGSNYCGSCLASRFWRSTRSAHSLSVMSISGDLRYEPIPQMRDLDVLVTDDFIVVATATMVNRDG